MTNRLIIAGAWLSLALFFLAVNLKTRPSVAKVLTYWGMVISAGIAIALVIITTLEDFDG